MRTSAHPLFLHLDCIAVVGPTAIGKSQLAQLLAQHFDTDVLSADSMQIYRGLDIGTAKLPVHQREVYHAGLDLVEPDEPYSVALFQQYAREHIDKHRAQGELSVICGGTGLYLRAALEDFSFAAGAQRENQSRETYTSYAASHGPQALHDLLAARDSASAALIHPHNVRRVIRALELCDQNRAYASSSGGFSEYQPYYRQATIGLTCPRPQLYERINHRVDEMFDQGLEQEVRTLVNSGALDEGSTAAQAIGYKELIRYLRGQCTLDEARTQIKQASRRYAKRQLTWFRRYSHIQWFDVAEHDDLQSLGDGVLSYLNKIGEH